MNIVNQLNSQHIKQLHTLYQQEWWCKERTEAETQQCVDGSQVIIGITDSNDQLIGFARVLTDYIFKAMIFDVIVSEKHRGLGLGDKLIELIKSHPALHQVRHFELYGLPDMEAFYERHAFTIKTGGVKLMRHTTRPT